MVFGVFPLVKSHPGKFKHGAYGHSECYQSIHPYDTQNPVESAMVCREGHRDKTQKYQRGDEMTAFFQCFLGKQLFTRRSVTEFDNLACHKQHPPFYKQSDSQCHKQNHHRVDNLLHVTSMAQAYCIHKLSDHL